MERVKFANMTSFSILNDIKQLLKMDLMEIIFFNISENKSSSS